MAAADKNRDDKGRFVPGNKAGKGRPRVEYADAFTQVVDMSMWEKLILRAYIDGMKGDQASRAWLADRIVGKPPQILELRAGDAALLKELLQRFEAQGIPASDVFNAMLATFADEIVESDVDHDEYE